MSQPASRLKFWFEKEKKIGPPMLVALILRLGLMIAAFLLTGTHVMTQGDTASYLEPGRNLLLHGAFTTAGLPETDRTPGYPLFAMFTGMAFNNVLLTVAAQILVSLAALLLIRRIADRVFPDSHAGVLAAWFYALEPISILYTVRLMPETLFVLLLLVVIERVIAFQSQGKLVTLFAAGIWLAAATFVRPVSYYLGFALAIRLAFTALAFKATRHKRYWWKAPCVLLLSVLPWLAAWQVRNWGETGYHGFSSIVEKNLYFFQSAEVTAELRHITLAAEQKDLGYLDEAGYVEAHPEQREWNQAQRLHFMRAQAMEILSQHRELYLKTHLAGVGLVAFTPCATELLELLDAYPADTTMPRRILNEGIASSTRRVVETHPKITVTMAIMEIYLLLLYGLAILGTFFRNGNKASILTLVGISLYFLFISGGAQAVGRYRLPVMPELCVLAAGGLFAFQKEKDEATKTSPI